MSDGCVAGWIGGKVGGELLVFLLNFMIEALKVMKENVEGADGRVWRRGRARCKLFCRPI